MTKSQFSNYRNGIATRGLLLIAFYFGGIFFYLYKPSIALQYQVLLLGFIILIVYISARPLQSKRKLYGFDVDFFKKNLIFTLIISLGLYVILESGLITSTLFNHLVSNTEILYSPFLLLFYYSLYCNYEYYFEVKYKYEQEHKLTRKRKKRKKPPKIIFFLLLLLTLVSLYFEVILIKNTSFEKVYTIPYEGELLFGNIITLGFLIAGTIIIAFKTFKKPKALKDYYLHEDDDYNVSIRKRNSA